MRRTISLVVIKPLGYSLGTNIILDSLFNEQRIPKCHYIDKNKNLPYLLKSTRVIKKTLYKGNFPDNYLELNYGHVKKVNPKKYQDIAKSLNIGNKFLYIIENNEIATQDFFDELRLLKGKTAVVKYANYNRKTKKVSDLTKADTFVLRGYGIRGLYCEMATKLDKKLLYHAEEKASSRQLIIEINKLKTVEKDIYRRMVSKNIDNLMYKYYPKNENLELILDTIHIASTEEDAIESIKILERL